MSMSMTIPFPKATLGIAPPSQSIAPQPSMPPQVPYRQHQRWTNWGQTAQCSPEFTFYPRSVEDLGQIVHFARATGRKIRVAATGHSWSALVPTDDILVSVRHFNQVTMDLADAAQPKVIIESGATVKAVNDVLEAHGCALPLNVVLESVRFGGLIATGSHGSGWNEPTLSDLVSSIDIIDAAGELRRFERGIDSDEVMNAARLNLGLFGIIYRVTLQVQKTWHVRAVDHRLPTEQVLEHLQEWIPAHDSMDLFWWPFCNRLWVKSWDRVDAEMTDKPRESVRDRLGAAISARLHREALRLVNAFPSLTPAFCQTVFRATPSEREKTVEIVEAIHYRRAIDVVKMGCVEIAFKVDPMFQTVKWAIQIVREMTDAYAARGEYPLNVTMNVRFIQNSQCWLSPAFGEGHTCYIEILSGQHTRGWEQFSGEVARQWLQLPHALPHWAKEYQHIPGVIEQIRREMGGNIARFNEIKARLQVDPDQMFVNAALQEVFF